MSCNWDECILNYVSSINWRASLVPAAAVIPAPIAYINVVAVKKLVVGFLTWGSRSALQKVRTERPRSSLRRAVLAFSCRGRDSRRLL